MYVKSFRDVFDDCTEHQFVFKEQKKIERFCNANQFLPHHQLRSDNEWKLNDEEIVSQILTDKCQGSLRIRKKLTPFHG